MPVLWDNGEKTEKSQKNRPALLAICQNWCIVCVLTKDRDFNHKPQNKEIAKGLSETGVSKETRNGYESSCKKEWNFHG